METRFVLPATIAIALHALVLFGPRSPAVPLVTRPDDAGPKTAPMVINLNDPEDQQAEESPADPKPARTSPPVAPPRTEEPPPSVAPDGAMLEKVPVVTRVVIDASRVLPGVPGRPHGGESGGWAGAPVIDQGQLDNPPHAELQVPPFYPGELKSLGITGEVMVEFTVDTSGRVVNPRVVRSSHRGFEEATLRAVARWRFEPGRKDGRPVRFRMAVPVEFKLGD